MDEYPLMLSLVDFIPNIAFIAGIFYLLKFIKIKPDRKIYNLLFIGGMLVFSGGMLKALWKLLYTMKIADIVIMSEAQFVLLAPGFLMMFLAMILFIRKKEPSLSGAVLAMAAWKIPFLAVVTLSSIGFYASLAYMSFKRRCVLGTVGFILALVIMLGMAGMAGGEQTIASQWIEEGVNSTGQVIFALASYLLYRTCGPDEG